MQRADWLKEKRHRCEVRMDTLFAADYDQHWGHINPTHRGFMQRFLRLCLPGGTVLDAACGTGKYWPMLLESNLRIYGIDQSSEMLKSAHAKFPDVPIEKLGLQDLRFADAFDGIICVDAMENICPEDWPLIMANFYRALKTGGPFYFTVEIIAEEELRAAVEAARRLNLPVVEGEYVMDEALTQEAGYHYYPPIDQARRWTEDARFTILDEAIGDGYYHFLVRKS
jgi:cyclopropane fatty-acyl-phospholipid synthase-like methyltransferase